MNKTKKNLFLVYFEDNLEDTLTLDSFDLLLLKNLCVSTINSTFTFNPISSFNANSASFNISKT